MANRTYEIILSPDLAITPAEFAAAWNDLTETHNIGPARIEKTRGAQFDPTLVATILITIASGAAANLISESIIKIIEKHNKHTQPTQPAKHTHIEHIKKPDGTETFIADIE